MVVFRRISQVRQYGQYVSNHSLSYSPLLQRERARNIFNKPGISRMFCSARQSGDSKYWNPRVRAAAWFTGFVLLVTPSVVKYFRPKPFDPEQEMISYMMTRRPEKDEYFDELVCLYAKDMEMRVMMRSRSIAARRLQMFRFCDKFLEKSYGEAVDLIHILEKEVLDVAYVTNNDTDYISQLRSKLFSKAQTQTRYWNEIIKSQEARLKYVNEIIIPEFLILLMLAATVSVWIFLLTEVRFMMI
eukprot:291620_1